MIDKLKGWWVEIVILLLVMVAAIMFISREGCIPSPQTSVSDVYAKRIDSLKNVIDTLSTKVDVHFVERSGNTINTEVRYIIKEQKLKDETYISLDTTGRVAYFRKWLLDSAAIVR